VKLGPGIDGLRVVKEGLSAGDRIVVNGLQRVRPGAPLAPQDVPMDAERKKDVAMLGDTGKAGTADKAANTKE